MARVSVPARLSVGPAVPELWLDEPPASASGAPELQPLAAPVGEEGARRVMHGFAAMSFWFSLNHGAVMGALALASSVLGTDLGGAGSGTLYLVYTSTALLLASAVSGYLGPRRTLVGGLLLYSFYLASFLVAFGCSPRDSDGAQAPCAWIAFNAGSALGGFAAGVYWTAQGAYFTLCAKAYAEALGIPFSAGTAKLSGVFACIYLLLEVVAKLFSYAVLESYGEDGADRARAIIFSVFTFAAFVSAVGMIFVADPPGGGQPAQHRRCREALSAQRALAAGRLLAADRRMQLLCPTNATFGFVSSFSNNVVNARIIKEHLGESAVPLTSAMLSGVAAAVSIPLGRLGSWAGSKAPGMVIGQVMFVAECVIYAAFSERQLGTWTAVTLLTFAQGMGRAMWEGPNRGVTADYFDGPDRDAAFANIVLQMGVASTVGFYAFPPLLDAHGKTPLAVICLASAAVALVAFGLLCLLPEHRRRRSKPASSDTASCREEAGALVVPESVDMTEARTG